MTNNNDDNYDNIDKSCVDENKNTDNGDNDNDINFNHNSNETIEIWDKKIMSGQIKWSRIIQRKKLKERAET